ncbi:MAG: ABC-F family ATP-binding cassette domain-containing protein [Gaiellaceae bacterium]
MQSLSLDNVTKHLGPTLVLDRVSLVVSGRARIGIVGPNGAGKTTLLRLLAGLEPPDEGRVVRSPGSLRTGYLPQETEAKGAETVLDYLARRTDVAQTGAELDALTVALESDPRLAERHGDALERFLALGGHDLAARAGAACSDVGLQGDVLERPLRSLSGGQAARAALAALLLARFDVFLLDEPTNDLDFAGLERLERFVAETGAAVVAVSHDRAFLDRTARRIVELENGRRRVREYTGGWSEYEAERDRARARAYDAHRRAAEERARLQTRLHDRRTEARAGGRQANRRGTHALASKVSSVERRLERLDEVEKPWEPWRLELGLTPVQRTGDVVVRLEKAVVERGDFRLGPVNVEVGWGDRVAVVGPNGSGKTTVLEALTGRLPLAAGCRVVGPQAELGEVDQLRSPFAGRERLLASFTRESGLDDLQTRTLLAKFGLGADDVRRPGRTLSPGERSRALLALLLARGVNCLVLDEPTNHLDLPAIEELEAALTDFSGSIVLVTHDRRLLERFEPTQTLELLGT